MVLEFDLNELPPVEHDSPLDTTNPVAESIEAKAMHPTDDVKGKALKVYKSKRGRADEHKSKEEKIVDQSDVPALKTYKRKRTSQLGANNPIVMAEGNNNNEEGEDAAKAEEGKPSVEPKPSLSQCRICKDAIRETELIKCGHIFCKECVLAAVATKTECPICTEIVKLKRKTQRKKKTRLAGIDAPSS